MFWIDALKALAGTLFGVFAVAIYWKVKRDGDLAMNSFQLNKEEVLQDYRIILVANIGLLVAFGFHILSALEIISLLYWKVLSTLYILVIMFVLVRWVKLFR